MSRTSPYFQNFVTGYYEKYLKELYDKEHLKSGKKGLTFEAWKKQNADGHLRAEWNVKNEKQLWKIWKDEAYDSMTGIYSTDAALISILSNIVTSNAKYANKKGAFNVTKDNGNDKFTFNLTVNGQKVQTRLVPNYTGSNASGSVSFDEYGNPVFQLTK